MHSILQVVITVHYIVMLIVPLLSIRSVYYPFIEVVGQPLDWVAEVVGTTRAWTN